MLVLSRKIGETIVIGDQAGGDAVTITILPKRHHKSARASSIGQSVAIGIDAGKHIPIVRGELTKTS